MISFLSGRSSGVSTSVIVGVSYLMPWLGLSTTALCVYADGSPDHGSQAWGCCSVVERCLRRLSPRFLHQDWF